MASSSRVVANPAGSAALFAALGDPTRLKLVARLCEAGPESISRLGAGFAVTRQAISKHLRVLELAGLARSARSGRETLWELDPARLTEAQALLDQMSRHWDGAIEKLRAIVEEPES